MSATNNSFETAIREMLDGLSLPFPEALPPGLKGARPESLWRYASDLVTDGAARSLWLEWNPDLASRIENPAFFRAFREMLRDVAALGLKVDRFREASRELTTARPTQKEWRDRFEEVINNAGAGIRVYLSRDCLESFKRSNQDAKGGAGSWDDLVKTMSDGLFYELGLTFPPITFAADEALNGTELRCEWNDLRLPAIAGLSDGRILVNDTVERLRLLNIEGEAATNPANGNECATVDASFSAICAQAGLTTWDVKGYAILAISGIMRRAAASFVNRSLVDLYMFRLGDFDQELVELTDASIDRSLLVQILRSLLAEEISIRNLSLILNRLVQARSTFTISGLSKYILFDVFPFTPVKGDAEYGDVTRDEHVESARCSLKRYISHKYTRGQSTLIVYLLDPELENRLGQPAALDEREHAQLIKAVREEIGSLPPTSQTPVVLTTMEVRHRVWRALQSDFKDLVVLSYQELSPEMNIQPIARIDPELEPYKDNGFLRLIEAVPVFPPLDLERLDGRMFQRSEEDQALLELMESQRETILDKTTSEVLKEHPVPWDAPLERSMRRLLERVLDSYCEVFGTDQTTALDELFRTLAPAIEVKGGRLSHLVQMPLVMIEVIRELLAERYRAADEGALSRFKKALDRTEAVAYRSAERLVAAGT